MGVRYSLRFLPSFLPGEELVVPMRRVWFASFKSLPSYRLQPCVPVLLDTGLYVTSRRVVLVGHLLRCLGAEVSQWFEPGGGRADEEVIREARTGKSCIWGAYLETVSEDPRKRWYRSARLRTRLYMKDPQPVCQAIAQIMAAGASRS